MWWVWIVWMVLWTTIEAGFSGVKNSVKAAGALLLILIILGGVVIAFFSPYNNAVYFDTFIQKADGFPIQSEVPDNLVRLTTEELARSIASQRMSELGGALEIVDMQVTTYEGRLVWVAVVARPEAWGAKFRTAGLVIVDANEPDRTPTIVKESFPLADGLDFNPIIGAWGSVRAKGFYGIDTALSYGDTYPVRTPEGGWAIAVTTYRTNMLGVREYSGVYVIDQGGNIIDHHVKDLPAWLIQPFDEQSFLEGGVDSWGGTKRGGGFDVLAEGFLWIPPSQDRLAIAEDTRYIYDPDLKQVVAMIMIYPVRDGGDLSLAGAFKVTPKGISYYDLKQHNMMSGKVAGGIVKSKITARAGTNYFTAMELLYPVRVGDSTRYAWFVPIYFQSQDGGGLMGLAGLGLVDAQEPNKVTIQYTGEGVTGATLVRRAKQSFRTLYGEAAVPTSDLKTVDGELVEKQEPYTREGNTRQWLTVETSEGRLDVLVKAELLSDAELLKIQKAKVGDTLTLDVDRDNVVRRVR
jgi:hypothetical protein